MQRSICLSFLALSMVLANVQPPPSLAQNQPDLGNSANNVPMPASRMRVPMGKGTIEAPLKSLINPAYPLSSSVKKPKASGRVVAGTPAVYSGAGVVGSVQPASTGSRIRPQGSKSYIETPLKEAINPLYGAPQLTVPAKPLSLAPLPKPAPIPVVKPSASRTSMRPVIDEQVVGVDANGVAKVRPGKVSWRGNFELARAAAAASGRPVLQFAMIGSLDDKFC